MKILFCLLLSYVSLSPAFLNPYKIYPIVKEICTYRGVSYEGSNTIDLSNMDLESLNGISVLLVELDGEEVWIDQVPRLRIVASNNKLKSIPGELKMLNCIAIDLTHNDELEIPDWMWESKQFHLYCCYGFFRRSV